MFTCAQCAVRACESGQLDKMPKNCPMRDSAYFDQLLAEYEKLQATVKLLAELSKGVESYHKEGGLTVDEAFAGLEV